MSTRLRVIRWVAGALAIAGVVTLATAVYVVLARSGAQDNGEPTGRPGQGPVPNAAGNRSPPPGFSPGPGGPRDEPVAMDAALEEAVLHEDGTVTATGYLVCTPGEKMNVGWAIWNERSQRDQGMVRTGVRRLYFECTGERQDWTLRGYQVLGQGIEPGAHPYSVKTAVGTGSRHDHRDYFQGTITVQT